ncbi:MAG: YigZ family protein [Oscillospiraceae bacterium]|nr:YigZ family protein [Oscillospiraceae bacterium]
MTEYLIPTKTAESEFVEKKSRFIGNIWPVETEEEARAHIEEMKKKHYGARHNCWAYRLKTGGGERYSDDGEPQGTAGQPMLGVFQREEVWNVLCVVTRYFGGILLGAGGLTRAYARSAKDTLDASGISVVRPWTQVECDCPYGLFDRLKLELLPLQGVEGEHEFGLEITFRALLPEGREEEFGARLREVSAGGAALRVTGTVWKAVPLRGEGQV